MNGMMVEVVVITFTLGVLIGGVVMAHLTIPKWCKPLGMRPPGVLLVQYYNGDYYTGVRAQWKRVKRYMVVK